MKAHRIFGSSRLILIILLLVGGLTASAVTYADSILPSFGLVSEGTLFSGFSRSGPTTAPVTAGPTVTTDKQDYAPGETVLITATGFAAGEQVRFEVDHVEATSALKVSTESSLEEADHAGHEPWYVNADSSGNVSTSWLVQEDSLNKTLKLTALGMTSGLYAETTFTDGSIGTYDQCSNDDGDGYATGDTGCRWTNGNLQANNSTYVEGDSTVQRAWLTLFEPGDEVTVTFQYGTTKAGKHAYDYLTTFDASESWISEADQCQDITGCTAAGETQFPMNPAGDPNVPASIEPDPATRFFTIRGGTITSVSAPVVEQGTYASDSETVVTVSFTVGEAGGPMCKTTGPNAGTCDVALWFGAHIARSDLWTAHNQTTGAGSINGSPYHVALYRLDGLSIGNRDNQMQANTLVAPKGTITIVKETVGGNGTFDFTASGTGVGTGTPAVPANFQLTTVAGTAQTSWADVAAGVTTIAETGPTGDWAFTSVSCTGDTDGGNVITGQSVAIDLDDAESITCTFRNTLLAPSINVEKSPSVDAICAGSTTDVTYTYVLTNTGPIPVGSVVLSDDNGTPGAGNTGDDFAPTFQGGDTNGNSLLDTTETWTYSATRNIGATTTNTVTASSTSAGGQAANDTDSATVTASVCTINIDKTSNIEAVCAGSTTDVTYTYVVTTNATVFDASVVVVDDNGTAGTGDDFNPTFQGGDTSGDGRLDPGETWTYTAVVSVGAEVTNTATATATFTDSDATVDTDTDTATVTASNCTINIDKTSDIEAVCAGSTTSVTYTYTVTTNATVFDASIVVVDDNGTAGTGDDFNPAFQGGDTSADGRLDPGETWTYTAVVSVGAEVTNTATATATFTDSDATVDTDSDTATVTASNCTINIDKTSDIEAVCAGSTTSVTYTYTVTTNATVFDASIVVVDDNGTAGTGDDFNPTFQSGDTSGDGRLDPGETWTYTAVVSVGASVTNTATATATFNDSDSTVDTDTDTATVTAYVCTITVTKTPSTEDICVGAEVDYTYSVTNNSDFFTWTGSLVDDNGTPGNTADDVTVDGSITLGPGATDNTFALNDVALSADTTNVATASGDFDDADTTTASDTASASVDTHTCKIIVKKLTDPAEDPVVTLFAFTGDASGSIGHNETIEQDVTAPGEYDSTETDLLGWDLTNITCDDANSSGDLATLKATFNVELGETVTCTFTNTERGTVTLIKTENGLAPTRAFTFEIREGATPEEDGDTLASGTAGIGQTDPVVFDCVDGNEANCEDIPGPVGVAHFPPGTYQLCETGLFPGWTHTLGSLGTVFVPNSDVLVPDNTVECVDIVITAGGEFDAGIIDNRQPGDARTIGFWKNWTSCDGTGNQAPALDYVLSSFGGATVDIADTPDDPTLIPGWPGPYTGVWLGLPEDGLLINNCLDAVSILDKRTIDRTGRRDRGKKAASDPAFNMAAQLLAAKLNLQAGATEPICLSDIIAEADQLLADVNFNGQEAPNYGNPSTAAFRKARMNYLAGLLDDYNNNELDCLDYSPLP